MTVSELIERLKQFHPDLPVYKAKVYLDIDDEAQQYVKWELLENDISRERIDFNGDIATLDQIKRGHTTEAVVL